MCSEVSWVAEWAALRKRKCAIATARSSPSFTVNDAERCTAADQAAKVVICGIYILQAARLLSFGIWPLNLALGAYRTIENAHAYPRGHTGGPGPRVSRHSRRPKGERPGRRPLPFTPSGGDGRDVQEVAAGGCEEAVERQIHPRRLRSAGVLGGRGQFRLRGSVGEDRGLRANERRFVPALSAGRADQGREARRGGRRENRDVELARGNEQPHQGRSGAVVQPEGHRRVTLRPNQPL